MNNGKVKYTVTFSEKISEIIDQISEKECISKPETLRRAIALYSYIYKEISENESKLCITNTENDVLKEIIFQ